jgi:hypothetical protein
MTTKGNHDALNEPEWAWGFMMSDQVGYKSNFGRFNGVTLKVLRANTFKAYIMGSWSIQRFRNDLFPLINGSTVCGFSGSFDVGEGTFELDEYDLGPMGVHHDSDDTDFWCEGQTLGPRSGYYFWHPELPDSVLELLSSCVEKVHGIGPQKLNELFPKVSIRHEGHCSFCQLSGLIEELAEQEELEAPHVEQLIDDLLATKLAQASYEEQAAYVEQLKARILNQ